ncbi:MAG: GDSL-type esterase/lipase family protein [bacterium]
MILIKVVLFSLLLPGIVEDDFGNVFLCQEQYDLYYQRIEQFTEQNCSIPPGGIVFIGNSITQGFLLQKYFPGTRVYNRGIVADKIGMGDDGGVLKRLDVSCFQLKPSRIFLMIGINDVADGRRSVSRIASGYQLLIDTILDSLPWVELYVHSILPTRDNYSNLNPRIDSLNELLQQIIDDRSMEYYVRYIDLHMLFKDQYGNLHEEFTWDGIHLTERGYTLWADFISTLVNPDYMYHQRWILSDSLNN